MRLGVLKLGVDVNQIENKPFPKFKNVLVQILIEKSKKLYQRIPIPVEGNIEQKIQELLDKDIIEEVKVGFIPGTHTERKSPTANDGLPFA